MEKTNASLKMDNSAASQRSRILNHLRTKGTLTTLQARHELCCMHPGMRICELRKSGHPIVTVWVNDISPEGHKHRCGQYFLLRKKQLSLLNLIPTKSHNVER